MLTSAAELRRIYGSDDVAQLYFLPCCLFLGFVHWLCNVIREWLLKKIVVKLKDIERNACFRWSLYSIPGSALVSFDNSAPSRHVFRNVLYGWSCADLTPGFHGQRAPVFHVLSSDYWRHAVRVRFRFSSSSVKYCRNFLSLFNSDKTWRRAVAQKLREGSSAVPILISEFNTLTGVVDPSKLRYRKLIGVYRKIVDLFTFSLIIVRIKNIPLSLRNDSFKSTMMSCRPLTTSSTHCLHSNVYSYSVDRARTFRRLLFIDNLKIMCILDDH